MILVVAVALVTLSVPLTGGDLRRLHLLHVRGIGFVFTAITLQLVVTTVASNILPTTAAEALHLVSYGLAVAFLFVNRRIAGLWIVALGGGLNLAAIAANHGVMPATNAALRYAGREVVTVGFSNSNAVTHARLAFLGDVFAVPRLPLANVFSIGDLLLVLGIGVILHSAARKFVWSETGRSGRFLTKQSDEAETGWSNAGLRLSELDDELGAMRREHVLAQQHRPPVGVGSDPRAAQHRRARGMRSSSASSASAAAAPIVCVAPPSGHCRAARRTASARRRRATACCPSSAGHHTVTTANGSPSARLSRLTRSTWSVPSTARHAARAAVEGELEDPPLGPAARRASSCASIVPGAQRLAHRLGGDEPPEALAGVDQALVAHQLQRPPHRDAAGAEAVPTARPRSAAAGLRRARPRELDVGSSRWLLRRCPR